MNKDKVNIGVIGAGRIGIVHSENLAFRIPQSNLVSIADINIQAAEKLANRCRCKAVADYHDILNDDNIDAVLICSSTDTHARIIEEASAAQKHIFCEKPIAQNLQIIDKALKAVEKAGVKLQIGFNRRFDPNFVRARMAVENGEVGTPYLMHIISRDPNPPPISYVKVSGGIFMDMTIHDFDMARYIMGCEVEEIYTLAGVMVDPAIGEAGDLDTAIITLRFMNGAIGTIDNCRKATYGYDQRIEVFGSNGAIQTTNNYPNSAILSSGKTIYRDLPLTFFMDRYTESFVREVSEFIAAVLKDQPTPVKGLDGRIPVAMALAARKSHDEHRPVKLSEIT